MTRVLAATCENSEVKISGLTVQEAEILSEGIGQSTGCVIISKDKVFYITSNATDLKDSITKVVEAITKISSILTSIGAGMTGPTTAPPPTLATDVLELNGIGSELTTISEALK